MKYRDNHYRNESLPYLYALNINELDSIPLDGYAYNLAEENFIINKTVELTIDLSHQIEKDWYIIINFNDIYKDSVKEGNLNLCYINEVPKVLKHTYKYKDVYHISIMLFIEDKFIFEKILKVIF